MNYFLDNKLLSIIETARKETEIKISNSNAFHPDIELKKSISKNFQKSNFYTLDYNYKNNIEVNVSYGNESKHNFNKSIMGTTMVLAGQPILKKRFVMKGSAVGTSIASKYLSKALPQAMPVRILGTKVLGRAIGRAVPYVGWGLLAIDTIEFVIELLQEDNKKQNGKSGFGGFGGGSFCGGGAGGRW